MSTVLALVVLPSPATSSGAAQTPAPEEVAGRIAEQVVAPGATWVVSTPRGIETGSAGLDPDTVLPWGSVSKAVAGLVAAELVCAGRLDLDTPALGLLPHEAEPTDRRWDAVTVGMLLDHTSGVAPLLDQLDDDRPGRSVAVAVERVLAEPLVAEPGTAHHYSSANYLLLQEALARAGGRPYAEQVGDLLRDRGVAEPVASRSRAAERVAPGHRFVAGRAVGDGVRYDDLGLAYGYLAGSAGDLARVGRSVLADRREPGCTAGGLATTSRVDRGGSGGSGGYGLGWRVGGLGTGGEVLWHGGALPGHAALLALLPEQDAVVVVLQDAYSPSHDAALMAPGLDAVRVLAAAEPAGTPFPTGYWVMLAALALLATGLALAAGRLAQRPHLGPARAGAWALVGAAGVGVPLLLPRLVGLGDLPTLLRWQPDVAVLAAGCGLAGLLVVTAAVWKGVRRLGA